jgi:serine/threonine protein kinase
MFLRYLPWPLARSLDRSPSRHELDAPHTHHTHTHSHITHANCTVWLAPEILENKTYTEKADVYSLGVMFWELLTKERFFGDVKFMSVLEDMVGRPPLALPPPPMAL